MLGRCVRGACVSLCTCKGLGALPQGFILYFYIFYTHLLIHMHTNKNIVCECMHVCVCVCVCVCSYGLLIVKYITMPMHNKGYICTGIESK